MFRKYPSTSVNVPVKCHIWHSETDPILRFIRGKYHHIKFIQYAFGSKKKNAHTKYGKHTSGENEQKKNTRRKSAVFIFLVDSHSKTCGNKIKLASFQNHCMLTMLQCCFFFVWFIDHMWEKKENKKQHKCLKRYGYTVIIRRLSSMKGLIHAP